MAETERPRYTYDYAETAEEETAVESELDTYAVGETVELTDTIITIDSIEPVESFPMECMDTYYPPQGRSLFAVHATVTNTGNEVIYPDGQLLGSTWVTWRADDDTEMNYAFPGCTLAGEPQNGLMNGETASFPMLIESAGDAQPGWVEFDDASSAYPIVIILQEGLEVVFE
ncbi:hypothetical protein FM112_09740 [Gulosibacter sp. 10]|nr:hypothetical protein FM112_09740 [Gulosibacter sp. 10]